MTFGVRRLGPGDLPLLLDLQQRIRSALDDTSVFQTSTPDFIAYCLAGGGRCYGVLHERETVAYRIVYFPRDRDFNLAKDTTLDPAEYHRVAHWDTVAVLPGWRGHALARLMNARALADLADTDVRHLFATSSPANPHGVRTLMEAGFRPICLVRKFGGKLRFLLHRTVQPGTPTRIDDPLDPVGPAGEGPEKAVDLTATAELEAAFAEGWTDSGMLVDPRGGHARLLMRHRPLPFAPVRR
ncbi:GNAT family N-acetyltransferase [Streptomyces sp. NPDC021356]|uniref:GNAT family N-acetyltransferase n=1 Tax=Streptomyces sp. NPDC021356 TaxID=3154900 RepID=UPI0033C58BB2